MPNVITGSRKVDGAVLVFGGDCREFQLDTLRCVHCGHHWAVQPGSGRVRGYCGKCSGVTCGAGCLCGPGCVPHEQMLDNLEAGRPIDTPRPAISLPF